MLRHARSYLFVPGNRPQLFDKALRSGADEVIIDLEDAVPPAEKDESRRQTAKWLDPQRPVLIRVNAVGTEWFRDDVELCSLAGVAGVVVPKIAGAAQLEQLVPKRAILPLIETAEGFSNLREIARVENVQRLIFGALDFQLDLGIQDDGDGLLCFRSQLVLHSRLAGLAPPVDGVTLAFRDLELLRRETMRARSLGFGGKTCIHPHQVECVNRCFAPAPEEVSWARRVLEAASSASGSAVALDGQMIDRPVIQRAERVIDEAERLGQAESESQSR